MKYYFVFLVFMAAVGASLMIWSSNRKAIPKDQAGVAFTVDESGQLIPNDGTRANGRTEIPENERSKDGFLTSFTLTERSGELVGSKDLKGQPYVAGFFFSTCPSICVQQNTKVQQLQEKFKKQPIRFLSISCDPEVDTPEVLSKYADRFDADANQWLFLTGDMTYIRNVGFDRFRLGILPKGHPEKFALMDANDEMVGLYTWSDEGQWQTLQDDIEKLIANGGVKEPGAEIYEEKRETQLFIDDELLDVEPSEPVEQGN